MLPYVIAIALMTASRTMPEPVPAPMAPVAKSMDDATLPVDSVLGRIAAIERKRPDMDWLLAEPAAATMTAAEAQGAQRLATLARIARHDGLDHDPQVVTELAAVQTLVLAEAARRHMMTDIMIDDADVARALAANPDLYDEYRLSHIFVAVGPRTPAQALAEARAIKRRLDHGEDFGTLAKAMSDDGSTKADGGELSSMFGVNMADAFFPVVRRMAVGTISDPIRGPKGYHLIELEERHPASVKTARYFATESLRAARLRDRIATEEAAAR